jgi:hypothetical protein
MKPIHDMIHTFSSGPSITQSVPVAQRTPVIPTEFGIPSMSLDSAFENTDGRFQDIPAMDSMEDAVSPEKVRVKISGPNEQGSYAAGAGHERDKAVRGGFPDAKSAYKWGSTMQRKIAKQSLQHDDGEELAEDAKKHADTETYKTPREMLAAHHRGEHPNNSDYNSYKSQAHALAQRISQKHGGGNSSYPYAYEEKELAEDFNPELHKHFKEARESGFKPYEHTYHTHGADPNKSSSRHENGSNKVVRLKNHTTGKHLDIEHNSKHGLVSSEESEPIESLE